MKINWYSNTQLPKMLPFSKEGLFSRKGAWFCRWWNSTRLGAKVCEARAVISHDFNHILTLWSPPNWGPPDKWCYHHTPFRERSIIFIQSVNCSFVWSRPSSGLPEFMALSPARIPYISSDVAFPNHSFRRKRPAATDCGSCGWTSWKGDKTTPLSGKTDLLY